MNVLYIADEKRCKQLKEVLAAFDQAGYNTDNAQFGQSWEEFLTQIPDGSRVVVYSVDFFPSLMELLSTLAQLQERGITLQSLKEPWLSEQVGSTTEFLLKLKELALALHQNRTQAGLAKARAAGKKIGRPRKRGEQVK